MSAHKRNFVKYIASQRAESDHVDREREAGVFQALIDNCLAQLADDATPADGYAYNAHMGAMVRALDTAKEEWIKALHAFHVDRDTIAK